MRKLKSNEKFIKEYEKFVLIEVACPKGNSYKTTIDKWEQKDISKEKSKEGNTATYESLGWYR